MIAYNELNSPQAVAELRDYLVLALRSTGIDPARDRIFELGMLRVEDGRIVNQNSTLVAPGIPLPPEAAERYGISDADAASGLSYRQMAASLASLLLDKVVIADEEALGLVARMLEDEGFEGTFAFLDVRTLAYSLTPELGYLEPEQLSESLGLSPEDAPGILQDAMLRYAILQACRERIELAPAEEEDAEEETEADAPISAPGASPAPQNKKGLFPLIPLKSKAAKRRRRVHRDLFGDLWAMNSEDFIGYAGALASVIAALIFCPSWASLLFLLAGTVMLPLRPLRRFFRHYELNSWRLLLIGCVIFVLACFVKPHTPGSGKPRSADDGPPSFIILTWDQPGDYGQSWTAVNDNGEEETYIAFHLPSGIYRVLNNNAASAKVTVCDDEPVEKSTDIQDLLLEESSRSVTVLASKAKEIALDEGQHLRLSEGAENVIFQYLSEIPEVVVDEKDEEEDNTANAIPAWVNGQEVRLRKSASISAFIMATFDTGKEVMVTGTTGDWTQVIVANQKGYIYSKYITYEKPAS